MSTDPEHRILLWWLDARLDQIVDSLNDHGRRPTALELAVNTPAATESSHCANTM